MLDVISRDDAARAIMTYLCRYCDNRSANGTNECGPCPYDSDDGYTILSDVPTYNPWIPCEKRLPNESGEYWVTVKDCDSFIVLPAWFWKDSTFTGEKVGWNMLNEFAQFNDSVRDKVIAWMPLPDAYIPEKE